MTCLNLKCLHILLIEKLLEQKESFDIVCAMEIIEHVNNPVEFLRTCAELVKVYFFLYITNFFKNENPISH